MERPGMEMTIVCFVEFWSSQLNYRGPRGTPKAKDHDKTDPGATENSPQTPAAQFPPAAASDSLPQPHPANQIPHVGQCRTFNS
jgi:hypothetical protein